MAEEKTDQSGGTGTETGATGGGTDGKTSTTGTDIKEILNNKDVQAEIDRRVTSAVQKTEERIRGDMTRATEESQKKAAEDLLAKQGEYKTLAETKAQELEAANKKLEAYGTLEETAKKTTDIIAKMVDADVKALGLDKQPHILDLLKHLDVTAKAEWIAAHKEELTKATGGTVKYPGTPGEKTDKTKTTSQPAVLPLSAFG